MSEMNTIAFCYGEDATGIYLDFQRFTCKRPETAARYMRELFESSLYRACTKGVKQIHIYKTPDHYHTAGEPYIFTDFQHT